MSRSYVPYDFYPEFVGGADRGNVSSSLRLRALFFDRCVIAADVLVADSQILSAVENNLELCRSGFIEVATYDSASRLSEHTGRHSREVTGLADRIARLEDAGLRTMSYDPMHTSDIFKNRVIKRLEEALLVARSKDFALRIDIEIARLSASQQIFSLDDALDIKIAPAFDGALHAAFLSYYAAIGSTLVMASPILPVNTYHKAIENLELGITQSSSMLQIGHSLLLSIFSIRQDILSVIPDREFASFVRGSKSSGLARKLMLVVDKLKSEADAAAESAGHIEEISALKTRLEKAIREEVMLERRRSKMIDWSDATLMEAIGAVFPGAGLIRKVGQEFGKGIVKRAGLGVHLPQAKPLHEYVSGLQNIMIEYKPD